MDAEEITGKIGRFSSQFGGGIAEKEGGRLCAVLSRKVRRIGVAGEQLGENRGQVFRRGQKVGFLDRNGDIP